LDRIEGPLRSGSGSSQGLDAAAVLALIEGQANFVADDRSTLLQDLIATNSESLLNLPLPGGIGEDPSKALPDFPLKITEPNAYYLYVGPSE